VTFRTAAIDDQPGRNDWVIGTMDVYDRGSAQSYRYSCLVNFNNGQIRSVEIDAGQGQPDYRDRGDRRQFRSPQEQDCERAVVDRLRRDRYSNIDIEAFQGDQQGRGNWIAGSVRAPSTGTT
jgi:hypothetical protein